MYNESISTLPRWHDSRSFLDSVGAQNGRAWKFPCNFTHTISLTLLFSSATYVPPDLFILIPPLPPLYLFYQWMQSALYPRSTVLIEFSCIIYSVIEWHVKSTVSSTAVNSRVLSTISSLFCKYMLFFVFCFWTREKKRGILIRLLIQMIKVRL